MMMQQYSSIANRFPTICKEVGTQTAAEEAAAAAAPPPVSDPADPGPSGVSSEAAPHAETTDPKEVESRVSINDMPGTSGVQRVEEENVTMLNKEAGDTAVAEAVEIKVDEVSEPQTIDEGSEMNAAQNVDDSLNSKR